ncbi:MAG: Translocation and assembly module TamB [Syntrophaceae bacterium PtaB.Bin038]|nr:MAG: Translocation and assembly module TamB [Syntrophaceae bacterium PtaB.Bin038]
MSKRPIIGLSVLALALAAAAAAYWLVFTSAGSRFAVTALFRLLPVTVEAERIEGQLAREMTLEGLRVVWPAGEARVSSVRLRLQARHLASASVRLDEMDVQGVVIDDESPGSAPPYNLDWPRVPWPIAAIGGGIREFHVGEVTYRKPGKDPAVVREIRCGVSWDRGSVLAVRDLAIRLPDAKIEGGVRAGFLFPSLQADLTVRTERGSGEFDAWALKADLATGTAPEQISGPVSLSISSGERVRHRAEGKVGLTRKAVHFRNLRWMDGEGKAFVTAEGQVDVSTEKILAGGSFRVEGVSWVPALDLTGRIDVGGSPERYEGSIALENRGEAWRKARLSGDLSGTLDGIRVTRLTGRVLGGAVEGELRGAWGRHVSWTGSLRARNLNPAAIDPGLRGTVNLDIEGSARLPGAGILEGRVKGRLLNSRLQDRALAGDVDARWQTGMLKLERLFLQGTGFELHAAGALEERLTWRVQVSDPSALVPGSRGRLRANGWVRHAKERLSGAMTARGSGIALYGFQAAAAEADAEIESGKTQRLVARVFLKGPAVGPVRADIAELKSTGTVGDHAIRVLLESGAGKMEATLRGGYGKSAWKGSLEALRGTDAEGPWGLQAPAPLTISAGRRSVGPLRIAGGEGESLDFSMDVSGDPGRGFLAAEWRKINLARFAFVLPDWPIRGRTEGRLQADFRGNDRTAVSSVAALAASLKRGSRTLDVKEAAGKLDWNESGLAAQVRADLGPSGRVDGRVHSPEPPRFGLPDRGDFRISADGLDAAFFKPLLPDSLDMTGSLSGTAAGRLLPRSHVDAAGEVRLIGGVFSLRDEKGRLTAKAERARLRWAWREQTLSGDLDLRLSEHGTLAADFRLPVPARLPTSVEAGGPVRLTVRADMREKGVLSALFPGLVQESRGHLELNGDASGAWDSPRVNGTLKVGEAGATLPAMGIRVSDVTMEARFEDREIRVISFKAVSGPGRIEGSGTLRLGDRGIRHVEARLSGERFQTVRLPEMEMLASPDLTFEGAPKALKVRGGIVIPELLIRGGEKKAVIRPSKDVVWVGEGRKKEKGRPIPVDMEVRVVLGDRSFVKAEGVDARLEGDVLVSASSLDAVKATGEIRLKDGTYNTRGVSLNIHRGRILFEGGPADRPRLDVLALRTVEERPDQAGQSLGRFRKVRAGVIVTGTPLAPLVRLYSEPAMPDVDVLSYIVLGRRAGGDGAQSAMLGAAAEALLSGGGSESALSQLRRRFGPDTVEMKSATVGSTTQSIVTLGRHLQPNLYISYGRSLFNEDYYVTLRYTPSRRWEVESKAGAQTGANLYYRIEFD